MDGRNGPVDKTGGHPPSGVPFLCRDKWAAASQCWPWCQHTVPSQTSRSVSRSPLSLSLSLYMCARASLFYLLFSFTESKSRTSNESQIFLFISILSSLSDNAPFVFQPFSQFLNKIFIIDFFPFRFLMSLLPIFYFIWCLSDKKKTLFQGVFDTLEMKSWSAWVGNRYYPLEKQRCVMEDIYHHFLSPGEMLFWTAQRFQFQHERNGNV